MAAILPPELVGLLVDELNRAETPAARHVNRGRLRLVSRAWYAGVSRWQEVYVHAQQLGHVLALVEADQTRSASLGADERQPIARCIQRIHIVSAGTHKESKALHGSLSALLQLCVNVRELDVHVGDSLGKDELRALGSLGKMESLSLVDLGLRDSVNLHKCAPSPTLARHAE